MSQRAGVTVYRPREEVRRSCDASEVGGRAAARGDVRGRVEQQADQLILNDPDAIMNIAATAICGSDLHVYDGYVPTMKGGDILGHEFMGEVVAVGRGVGNLRVGDRVVVPFPIACGNCWSC